MERDGFACQGCKREDLHLNVHHAYYKPKTNPWEYPTEDLTTLCEDCHAQMTFYSPKFLSHMRTPYHVEELSWLLENTGGVGGSLWNEVSVLAAALSCGSKPAIDKAIIRLRKLRKEMQ